MSKQSFIKTSQSLQSQYVNGLITYSEYINTLASNTIIEAERVNKLNITSISRDLLSDYEIGNISIESYQQQMIAFLTNLPQ